MMVRSSRLERRRGAVLVLFCIVLIALCAYLALAIDIGVMAVARGQAQNAADAGAMNAVRQLNGSSGNNASACQAAAQLAVNKNSFLGTNFQSVSGVQVGGSTASPSAVLTGYYYYSQAQNSFLLSFPGDSTQSSTGASTNPGGNLTAVQTMVTVTGASTYFAQVLGIASFNTQTTATAVDRPRDIGLCVDFSGSMRFSSMVSVDYWGGRYCTNNPDANQPAFGHWNSTDGAQSMANSMGTGNLMVMQNGATISPGTGYLMQAINLTESNAYNLNRPLLVNDFFSNNQGASATQAFSAQPNSYATTPGGDVPLKSGASWMKTVAGYLVANGVSSGNSTVYNQKYETGASTGVAGYSPSTAVGYTVGPNYWGIRFMIWPPIPPKLGGSSAGTNGNITTNSGTGCNTFTSTGLPVDWRQAFFVNASNPGSPVTNAMLFNTATSGSSMGAWKTPSSNGFKINYQNILYWISKNPNNPFPSQMRAGNILYYSTMPNPGIDLNGTGALNGRMWGYSGTNLANLDEQFWKDYIDWCLGFYQWGGTGWTNLHDPTNSTSYAGYGGDFQWEDANYPCQVFANPTGTSGVVGTTCSTVGYRYGVNSQDTMDYRDNPQRALTFGWFGPMSLVDFLGSYNMWGPTNYQRSAMWPGTAHEAVTYICKLGLQAALQDSQNNHPNDNFTMAFYSVPADGNPASDSQMRFNRPRIPLGQNYQSAIDHLWYPPYTLDNPGTEIRPYDQTNNIEVPRGMGGTCYAMGLMLLYNQFSSNSTIQTFNPSPAPNGDAGGLGRIGAQKLVIMETDGFPNTTATATKNTGAGANKYYYQICYNSTNPGSSQFPSTGNGDNSPTIATALVTDFSTTRKPVKIYCLAFGPMFDPGNTASASNAASAISTLNNLQSIGNNSGVAVPLIYGSDSNMANGLQTAITNIFQSEIPVSLIKGANQNQ